MSSNPISSISRERQRPNRSAVGSLVIGSAADRYEPMTHIHVLSTPFSAMSLMGAGGISELGRRYHCQVCSALVYRFTTYFRAFNSAMTRLARLA